MMEEHKILIVDNNHSAQRLIKNMLYQISHSTCDVDLASSGDEALKIMRAKKFEIVFANWSMEPMTGLQLLKVIRADAQLRSLLVVLMMPGVWKTEDLITAKEAGVSNLIGMPFRADELKRKIEAMVGPWP